MVTTSTTRPDTDNIVSIRGGLPRTLCIIGGQRTKAHREGWLPMHDRAFVSHLATTSDEPFDDGDDAAQLAIDLAVAALRQDVVAPFVGDYVVVDLIVRHGVMFVELNAGMSGDGKADEWSTGFTLVVNPSQGWWEIAGEYGDRDEDGDYEDGEMDLTPFRVRNGKSDKWDDGAAANHNAHMSMIALVALLTEMARVLAAGRDVDLTWSTQQQSGRAA